MELANIIIAVLALIVAIIAIFVSIRQAIKSDNVALLGLRMEFYNFLCEFMRKYKMLADFEMMKNAKNSQLVFPQGNKTPLIQIVLSFLGEGKPVLAFQQITNDYNYLDINRYLFNKEIIAKINVILEKLSELKSISEECMKDKKTESELQGVLLSLRETLGNMSKNLLEDIKQIIATSEKYKIQNKFKRK
mgnify:CR=1 FL=1